MANITITIPDAKLTRVIDGICGHNGYEAEIRGGIGAPLTPNPESKETFAKRMLVQYLKDCVIAYEISVVAQGNQAIATDVNTLNIT